MSREVIYYRGRGGVAVTDRYLRTRNKHIALAPITSIRIGRDPLYLALAGGAGIACFALAFNDLLYLNEQIALVAIGIALLVAGFSVASLQLGTYAHERDMLWASYWTIRRVRDAIAAARRELPDSGISVTIDPGTL